MFDVGFAELLIIFVIGLLVLGPERLPRVATKIGSWIGQARRMTRQLRYQLEDEVAFSERREEAKKLVADLADINKEIGEDVNAAIEPLNKPLVEPDSPTDKDQ
ncbi:MAG: Sec-independent protein translocase protein TatB [Pseudomonadota bacterium]